MGAENTRPILGHFVIQLVLAVALTRLDGQNWAGLFVYVAATGGRLRPVWAGVAAPLLAAGGCAAQLAGLDAFQEPLALGITAAVVGLMMVSLTRLVWTRSQLRQAQGDVARLAAIEERLRIARDIHDLLGHSLSVIVLKADLAGRLLGGQPERAAGEIADVQAVVRRALSEVRDAVAGYRRLRLDQELPRVRGGLEVAGIHCAFTATVGNLPPGLGDRAGLGGAGRCHQRPAAQRGPSLPHRRHAGRGAAEAVVEDDGHGATDVPDRYGSGVAEATRGDDALDRALAARPDVALLDIELPGRSGMSPPTCGGACRGAGW